MGKINRKFRMDDPFGSDKVQNNKFPIFIYETLKVVKSSITPINLSLQFER